MKTWKQNRITNTRLSHAAPRTFTTSKLQVYTPQSVQRSFIKQQHASNVSANMFCKAKTASVRQFSIMSKYIFHAPKPNPKETKATSVQTKEAQDDDSSTTLTTTKSKTQSVVYKKTENELMIPEDHSITPSDKDSTSLSETRWYSMSRLKEASAEVKYGKIEEVKQPENPHALHVAMIGAANAGKSTLVNTLMKEKVSIVSPLPQTTRDQVIGVLTKGNHQIVFQDTPGIISVDSSKEVQRSIVTAAWSTIETADMALLIVDAQRPPDSNTERMVKKLLEIQKEQAKDAILVINKADLVPRSELKLLRDDLAESKLFREHFIISALHGLGTEDLLDYLMLQSIPREWSYSSTSKTDQSPLQIATEMIREKLFCHLYKELPYVVTQQNFAWTELPNGDLRIDQLILVPKESQKKIVIGKGGSVLLAIQSEAEADLSKVFKRKVHLFLTVKKARQP